MKVIHSGAVHHNRVDVRDDPSGAAVINKFQSQVRGQNTTQLRRKIHQLFSTMDMGPLENVFRQMEFKPIVFGSFGEMSTNVREYIELVVDDGADHLDRTMAPTTVDAVKAALRRRFMSQLSAANWRGSTNLVLDIIKYDGTCHTWMNMAHIRQEMGERADQGEYFNMWMAHETTVPLRDAFPGGRMTIWEDTLDMV